jgi:hypothetical protein
MPEDLLTSRVSRATEVTPYRAPVEVEISEVSLPLLIRRGEIRSCHVVYRCQRPNALAASRSSKLHLHKWTKRRERTLVTEVRRGARS